MKKIILVLFIFSLVGFTSAPASAWQEMDGLKCRTVPFSTNSPVWMIMWRGYVERLKITEVENCVVEASDAFFNEGGSVTIVVPNNIDESFIIKGYFVNRASTSISKFALRVNSITGETEFLGSQSNPAIVEQPRSDYDEK